MRDLDAQQRLQIVWLTHLNFIGGMVFTAISVLLHFIRRDLDPRQWFMSDYALGKYPLLFPSALVTAGLGILALGLAMYRTFHRVWWLCAMLATWGGGVIVAGIFRTDPKTDPLMKLANTREGRLHGFGAFIAFVTAPFTSAASMVVIDHYTRNKIAVHRLTFISGLNVLALIGFVVSKPEHKGIAQRICIAVMTFTHLYIGRVLRKQIQSLPD